MHVDASDTRAALRRALEQVTASRAALDEFAAAARRRDVRAAFLVGSGGSYSVVGPAAYLLSEQSSRFAAQHRSSASLVQRPPALLGPDSCVIVASWSGQTSESLEAAALARARGALVLTISASTQSAGTDVALNADTFGIQAMTSATLQAAYLLLGDDVDREAVLAAFDQSPLIVAEAVREADRQLLPKIASLVADASTTVMQFSPANAAVAAGADLTYLTEPRLVSADEDATWDEVTEEATVITWIGEDDMRDAGLRAHRFAQAHGRNAMTVDSADFAMGDLAPPLRAALSPLVLSALSMRLADHIIDSTGVRPALY